MASNGGERCQFRYAVNVSSPAVAELGSLGHMRALGKYFGRLFGAVARGRSQHLLDIALLLGFSDAEMSQLSGADDDARVELFLSLIEQRHGGPVDWRGTPEDIYDVVVPCLNAEERACLPEVASVTTAPPARVVKTLSTHINGGRRTLQAGRDAQPPGPGARRAVPDGRMQPAGLPPQGTGRAPRGRTELRHGPALRRVQGGNRAADLDLYTLCNALAFARREGLIRAHPLAEERPRFQDRKNVVHCREKMPADDDELHQLAEHLFRNPASISTGFQLLLEAFTGCGRFTRRSGGRRGQRRPDRGRDR